ncbi:hypothetical protein CLAFUW4_13604 [Fulvia fulva]|uniref:Uncharacterized protein n=1 Tax=Passalora fulva TaxID=5499 RepID=A0A9Q8PLA4_PASFU|nr:uncharacterized protein CLAFUR5_13456 [Fulvia fulva]KAK4610593.1 hypothetical protein CLAFUR4_13607 [Fulvia fulva]KAK4611249.1 hypothetical protein CLAFUR0_13612 [Fulvia fulva]UJO24558.1 hypothetical protein CLAFUR5_13456 [Fulvia fulva]WPV22275.1 hypothetical protein CLAFUW4_13604 [Fulvia fulva]WPV36699.1 hypothetical protein CLAFUW7_13612 [Fulvia fulva]
MPTTLLSQHPYLLLFAGTLGLLPLSIGTLGLLHPSSGWTIFNLPKPSTPSAQKVGEDFFLFWASRDVFMGLVTSAAWYHGDRKMMGYVMFMATMVGVVDGVMSRRVKGNGEWVHWGFVPVLGAVGGGLVGWWD